MGRCLGQNKWNIEVPDYMMRTSKFLAIYQSALNKEIYMHTVLPMDRFVGSCALQKGLMKFGIGVSPELAGELLHEFGGAAHFTASDLASFVGHGVSGDQVGVSSSAVRTHLHEENQHMAVGVVPSLGEPSVVAQQTNESSIVCLQKNTPYDAIPPQDDADQHMICPASLGQTGEETAQSEVLRVKSSKDPSSKSRWDELPCWARQSSRSALRELMGYHQR